jgi:hypothetical protein
MSALVIKKRFTEQREIEAWIRSNISAEVRRNGFIIDQNTGEVFFDPKTEIILGQASCNGGKNDKVIPIKFGGILNRFIIANCQLSSFIGCPPIVKGILSVGGNFCQSFEGISKECGHFIYLFPQNLKTLSGLNKYLKKARSITTSSGVKSGWLTPAMIEGCKELEVVTSTETNPAVIKRVKLAAEIVNKHLAGKRDTLALQEELIDNDFEEFATL